MVNMSSILNDINSKDLSNKELVSNLETLISQGTDIELKNSNAVNKLLRTDENKVIKLTTKLLTEWAKHDGNRTVLTEEWIINKLINLMDKHDDIELLINTVRALGNICYNNEEACNIVGKAGIDNVLGILKTDKQREDSTLTMKTAGLLNTLFTLHEGIPRTALKNGLLSILEQLFVKYSKLLEENQMLLSFLLSVLSVLSDYCEELNIALPEKLFQALVDIFKASTNPEISIVCLEIFNGEAEKDEIKTLLAKEGICEILFDLIEKHRHRVVDEESRSLMKIACDLIVIVLTGDEAMHLLYNNGEGKVYHNMITWMESEDNDILSTGVLAIGNFGRNEEHCVQMVKNGISKKLIDILAKFNKSTSLADVKIQHALLSTLKNLVIPKQNKAQVLKEGLIDVVYPMINLDQYFVVFKLLGTFRMVIDGQEAAALDLVSRADFLERLVYWCYNSDHLGVRGEVPRLLSWLIKHCHSFKPFKNLLIVDGCVKCIVEMTSSNHSVMQNEAFDALTRLCIGSCHSSSSPNGNVDTKEYCSENDKLMKTLIEADIGKNLNFVLTKYGEKMDKESISNLLTFSEQLIKSKAVVDHLKTSHIKDCFDKLITNPNVGCLSDKVNKIILALNE